MIEKKEREIIFVQTILCIFNSHQFLPFLCDQTFTFYRYPCNKCFVSVKCCSLQWRCLLHNGGDLDFPPFSPTSDTVREGLPLLAAGSIGSIYCAASFFRPAQIRCFSSFLLIQTHLLKNSVRAVNSGWSFWGLKSC